jgi:hypothetical protein
MTGNHADRRPRGPLPIARAVALALIAVGCADQTSPSAGPTMDPSAASASLAPASAAPSTDASAKPSAAPAATIVQPIPPDGLTVASDAARVDLAVPTFSNPTDITNPLFPISSQASVLMLGHVDDKPFRTEVTLLPYTHLIEWEGQRIRAVVSQYMAYSAGRITEVAYDLYAQADDGSVWYLGEDVFDFVDGAIATTEGTWQAGRDGPAAMIMPGEPKVGDVYRPENVPGFVFEEVSVQEIDQALDGPLGPISGGLLAHELHADGATEDKVFAPGYGEFLTGGDGDLEALAMAVPTDALADAVPRTLRDISGRALRIFDAAGSGDWSTATTETEGIVAAWSAHPTADVPAPIEPLLSEAVKRLRDAVDARKGALARNASIEVARLAFDIQLRYRPATEVDIARFDLMAAQLLVDAAAVDADGVNADVFALDYIRERFVHTLDASTAARLNLLLNDLQTAVIDDDLETSVKTARGLRSLVEERSPAG